LDVFYAETFRLELNHSMEASEMNVSMYTGSCQWKIRRTRSINGELNITPSGRTVLWMT